MNMFRPGGRRAAMLACAGIAAAAALKPVRAEGAIGLRELYDEAGTGPSALARRLEGKRVALEGLVAPVPSGESGWLALGETALVPCQLCGGPHDWPTGVVSVQGALPHLADPYSRVRIEGVLVLDPVARAATGLPDRLVLLDAGLANA